jgi:small subunit ribosomal protein S2
MPDISLRDLLDAGVHFGHQTRRWNPRMKPYIFGSKNGIHIINLQQTAIQLARACAFVTEAVATGEKILFVGTKRQASDIVAEAAREAGQYWVTHRWLGGMLTNFKTVKGSIERLNKLERDQADGRWELVSKKERITNERALKKLKDSLGGIQEMTALPGVIFIVDPKKEHIAVTEARRLGITLVAVCDTNCDPDGVDFVIPGNDDALKAIKLFSTAISQAAVEGRQLAKDYARREYSNQGGATYSSQEEAAGPQVVVVKGGGEQVVEAAAPAAEAPAAEAPAAEAPAAEAPAAEAPAAEAPAADEATPAS